MVRVYEYSIQQQYLYWPDTAILLDPSKSSTELVTGEDT